MDLTALFAALKTALLTKLSSIGASLAGSFITLVMGWPAKERAIATDVIQAWHDAYDASTKTGIDRIEDASESALNTFCNEEGKFFSQEAKAIITIVESVFKSALSF